MKTKKLMALMLVTMVTLSSLTACKPKSTPAPANTKSETPVTLKIWADAFEKSFPSGIQDDPVAKEITKKTGVIMDITPGNAFTDYPQKLAAALASNDLPDIFIANGDIAPKIISSKTVLQLDPYLDKYAKAFVNETPKRLEYQKKFGNADVEGKRDGKVYYFPMRGDLNTDPLQVQVAPYLRWDLYEKMGYPKINSMDDYIPILKKMMEMEPTNKDGKKNYGVSGWFGDWGNWVFGAGFGMMNGTSEASVATTIGTNKMYSSFTDPNSGIWQGLEWYNKAVRAGIMDPDAPTMKWDQFLEKSKANRFFFALAPWQVDNGNQTFTADKTLEKGYVQMPPAIKTDKYMVDFNAPYGGMNYYVSKKTKYPEKAVALLDYFLSIEGSELIWNGVKGVNWDVENGKVVVKKETLDGLANDANYKLTSGVYKYHNLAGRGKSFIDPKLNVPLYFQYQEQYTLARMTPIMKKAADYFKVPVLGDLYMKNKDFKFTISEPAPKVTTTVPDDIKSITTKANNYYNDNYMKIMMSKSEAEFQAAKTKFIEGEKTIGIEKVVDWNLAEFNKVEPGKWSKESIK